MLFETYLSVYDADHDSIDPYLRFNSWPNTEPLPSWITVINELLRSVSDHAGIDVMASDEGVPFSDVYEPIVSCCISDVYPERIQEVPENVIWELADQLCRRLHETLSRVLLVEFAVFSADRAPQSLLEDIESQDLTQSTRLYEEYVEHLLNGGLPKIIHTYPAIAPLLVCRLQQWVDFVHDFWTQFDEDKERIERQFSLDQKASITEITNGLGDPHRGGTEVLRIETGGERKLIYKPRSVEPELALARVIAGLNQQESPMASIDYPNVLSGASHGWMQYIGDDDEMAHIEQFYTRIGTVTALAYSLCITDLHRGNLIADGRQPVLVDGETTAMRENIPYRCEHFDSDPLILRELYQSVLNTGLLPVRFNTNGWEARHLYGNPKRTGDFSGIGSVGSQRSARPFPQWENVNTDMMNVAVDYRDIPPKENYPTECGTIRPEEYLSQITKGFRETYKDIMQSDRTEELASLFESVRTRYINRSTDMYYGLINEVTTPGHLRSGLHVSAVLDELTLVLYDEDHGLAMDYWPVIAAEKRAIVNGDIPRFEIRGGDLYFNDECVKSEFVAETAAERVRSRISAMSKRDMQTQIEYLRLALEKLQTGNHD